MYKNVLRRIHQAVLTGKMKLTSHALIEMDDDDLLTIDIESALMTGRIVHQQPGRMNRNIVFKVIPLAIKK